MKIGKSVMLMAMGAGVYVMYDKYGKKMISKMGKKMNKMIDKASNKLENLF